MMSFLVLKMHFRYNICIDSYRMIYVVKESITQLKIYNIIHRNKSQLKIYNIMRRNKSKELKKICLQMHLHIFNSYMDIYTQI